MNSQAIEQARIALYRRRPVREQLSLAREILVSYAEVRRRVRNESLDHVVADWKHVAPKGAGLDDPVVAQVESYRVARAIQRALGWLPTDTRCLMRSLVLTKMLSRRGIDTVLVIGVCAKPDFAAHAWVEHEGVSLLPDGGDEFNRLLEL